MTNSRIAPLVNRINHLTLKVHRLAQRQVENELTIAAASALTEGARLLADDELSRRRSEAAATAESEPRHHGYGGHRPPWVQPGAPWQ